MDLVQEIHDYETRREIERALINVVRLVQRAQDRQFREAVRELGSWTPECVNEKVFNLQNPYYSQGDERAPFFSETYLYSLLGKEDARTLLALMRPVFRAAGWPSL